MKISRNKRQFQISFDSNNEVNNNIDRQQQKDIIGKFIQNCSEFSFPLVPNDEIQKFKKKVIGSANQYGIGNQKTTSIFLSLLEVTRQIATAQLRKKQFLHACSYYAMCLGFVDPDDQIFLQKFIVTKIDIVNKLMFCLFQMKMQRKIQKFEKIQKTQKIQTVSYLNNALQFLQNFLKKARQYAFESNLLKSDCCMIELNYFYLGRVYRKKKNYPQAIQTFLKAQQIISQKKGLKVYQKNPALDTFSRNLQIKTFYKISKCYREQNDKNKRDMQQVYQGRALNQAQKHNHALFQYISRKIRMYQSSKRFLKKLTQMQGKKKIQQEILRCIEQSNQKEFGSLHDVYKDRPNNYSCTDIILKDCLNA